MLKFLLLTIAFILMHNLSFAQTIVRQSVGTVGKSGSADGVTVVHSTGQPYQTAGSAGFQPGFIQSNNLVFEKIASTIESGWH
jgi:hypothetical protein